MELFGDFDPNKYFDYEGKPKFEEEKNYYEYKIEGSDRVYQVNKQLWHALKMEGRTVPYIKLDGELEFITIEERDRIQKERIDKKKKDMALAKFMRDMRSSDYLRNFNNKKR